MTLLYAAPDFLGKSVSKYTPFKTYHSNEIIETKKVYVLAHPDLKVY